MSSSTRTPDSRDADAAAEPDRAGLSTAPREAPARPGELGARGLLRWCWRSLTSMRTALVLLFLLAVAAVPGSLVPQRPTSPIAVSDFLRQHPSLGPLYERIGLFDVYRSPWFAAIYLLLFISLIGCIVPRTRLHLRSLRARPPATPRNLDRFAAFLRFEVDSDPDAVLAGARQALGRRWRIDSHPGSGVRGASIAAETGFLRETGNLVFHVALLLILVGVAVGSVFGWKGNVIVTEGRGFSDTVSQFNSFTQGTYASESSLPPFTLHLDKLTVRYQQTGQQLGAPREYDASVTLTRSPGAAPEKHTILVNDPLVVGGAKIYLTGNGYAPVFTVRDAKGAVVFSGQVPFIPQDTSTFYSTGVVKVPDVKPQQLGFTAIFLPTAVIDAKRGPVSVFPDAKNPMVFLGAYVGDLGVDAGLPSSVYRLDTSKMTLVGNAALSPGQTYQLPGGRGEITFDGYRRWANFQVAYDPGRWPVFTAAVLAILGLLLSLFVRRRRVWVRALGGEDGRTVVEVAGLARSDSPALATEVARLAARIGGPAVPDDDADSDELRNDRLDEKE
ncbi:MAG: cytochrome c biogenesis protein ResB [Actinomycetales bacterium]